MLGLTAGFAWLVIAYPARPGPGDGRVREITIGPGDTLAVLSERLREQGLVRRATLFHAYTLAMGAGPRLRSGTVLLRDRMTPRELLQRLARGFGKTSVTVTLPEGYTRFDVAERLARWDVLHAGRFLAATEDRALLARLGVPGTTAEGYLFPDTYKFMDRSDPEEVLARLVRTGQQRVDGLLAPVGRPVTFPTEHGLSRDEVIVLASIVEKEAAAREEQAIIAGVFLNRLADPDFRPKRLQADPTVAYGCIVSSELPSCTGFDGRRVTRRMTEDPDNAYNTYRHEGLPPGPICNPGLSAIRAVLSPVEHGYLYFVAQGNGWHRFSTTLQEHNAAVKALRGSQ